MQFFDRIGNATLVSKKAFLYNAEKTVDLSVLIALIPAYNPIETLPDYISELMSTAVFSHVFVINDGSDHTHQQIFQQLSQKNQLTVLTHAINQGKGAALKTGLNKIALKFPEAIGVVTIDADGQHSVTDAHKIAAALLENPHNLIIGRRKFDHDTPARSAVGNFLTRHLFRLITGVKIFDTQSGLRGIPYAMLKSLLNIESNGYEFELDMLMQSNHLGFNIKEIPIETIYLEKNQHSSFRPILDSLKIYFVLFRFSLIAILSALLDYGVFIIAYYLIFHNVFLALVSGRFFSIIFNYLNVRKFAFKAGGTRHTRTLPKYLILACASGLIAYCLIIGLISLFHWHVIAAKIIAEIIMFVVNFFIQRDFIFKK